MNTYDISELGVRVVLLDLRTIRLRVKEESTHVTLGLERILVLAFGSLLFGDWSSLLFLFLLFTLLVTFLFLLDWTLNVER